MKERDALAQEALASLDPGDYHLWECSAVMGPPGPFQCDCEGPSLVRALVAAVGAVWALHKNGPGGTCWTCRASYPCDTVRALLEALRAKYAPE